ncbi:MAG: signal peptidase I [Cyanobacteriota bacterium]|nr:signal peptidase I [Cyanobacteriota bacterium]
MPDLSGESSHPAGRSGDSESAWPFWRSVLITLAVALGIRHLLVEARYIPSGSMLPGLQIEDRLLVEKLTYRNRPPRRGEIVVFRAPHAFDPLLTGGRKLSPLECLPSNLPLLNKIPGLTNPACDAYIKRVVALPGERISVDPAGRVAINGKPLREPYVSNYCPYNGNTLSGCKTLDTVVPAGHVVVLGDNRANSWDARFWPGGPYLPDSQILGRAFWRLFPFNRSGSL